MEVERVWTKHVDGFVCCGFGVFPYFDAWEVWHYHEGQWQSFKPLQPFATMEAAKSAALAEVAKASHSSDSTVLGS